MMLINFIHKILKLFFMYFIFSVFTGKNKWGFSVCVMFTLNICFIKNKLLEKFTEDLFFIELKNFVKNFIYIL